MTEWFENLQRTLDQTWDQVARGTVDRRAPARHPTLATVNRDGHAEARTVVLRAADRSAGTLDVYTDAASSKVSELRQRARATLHVWHPRLRLQMRLRGSATVLTGGDTAPVWARLSESQRQDYGGHPAPGTPIGTLAEAQACEAPDRFAVLRFALVEIETLHLGQELHYRALFERADDWAGTWLAP